MIENAAWRMVKLLSSMVDEEGHVLIDGFYDTIAPISPAQEEMMEELDFRPEELAKLYGVERVQYEDKMEFYRHLMFLPTLTINGLPSGYQGGGTNAIITCRGPAGSDLGRAQGH